MYVIPKNWVDYTIPLNAKTSNVSLFWCFFLYGHDFTFKLPRKIYMISVYIYIYLLFIIHN